MKPLLTIALAATVALAVAGCAPRASSLSVNPTAESAQRATLSMMRNADRAPGKGMPTAPEGTGLRAIQDRGRLIFGVNDDVPTFGFLNPTTNTFEGFEIDLAEAIAREILGPDGAVEFKQVMTKDRIPFLQQGVVDVVAATLTANEERANQLQFSDTYYVSGQTILVPIQSDITGIDDLTGKTVGTLTASTSEENLRAMAPGATVVAFDVLSEAVAAMDEGRLQAVSTDDALLFQYVYQSPDRYKLVGSQFTIEPYAMGIATGKSKVRDAVNSAIRKMKSSREWAELYVKNFGPFGLKAPSPPPRDWREVYEMPLEWRDVYQMTPRLR